MPSAGLAPVLGYFEVEMPEHSWLHRHARLHYLFNAAVIGFCIMAVISGVLQTLHIT